MDNVRPSDRGELARAIALRDSVDAYCVGHNGLGQRYQFDVLSAAVSEVRQRARRPVSTTEPTREYLENNALVRLGDWLFPDVHPSLRDEADLTSEVFRSDAARDATQMLDVARQLGERGRSAGRNVLLKITYPHAGVPGASTRVQPEFFRRTLDVWRDPNAPLPRNVGISVHSAFD